MKLEKTTVKTTVYGIAIGFVNGLFGAGGGMIAVPLLRSLGFSRKQAHCSSIAIIFPLCLISSVVYLIGGNLRSDMLLYLIPGGIVGSVIGTKIMKAISTKALRRIFALFMIYAGIKMIL